MRKILPSRAIDAWSIIYLILVLLSTFLFETRPTYLNAILCLLAFTFFNNENRLFEICLVLSTISYYYAIGDEQLVSIYTVLCLLCIIKAIASFKVNRVSFASLFPRIVLLIIISISYSRSTMSTFSGFMELVYIVLVSIVLSLFFSNGEKDPFRRIHIVAGINIIYLAIMLLINPITDGSRMQFSADVNANSFGFSASIMTLIIILSLMNYPHIKNRLFFYGLSILGGVLIFLSGSRNSLLALFATVFIMAFIKYGFASIKKYLAYGIVVLGVVLFIIPRFGLDSSRFSIDSVVETGGSSRTLIWEEMIPYVRQHYFLFGYGPGKAGSTDILSQLVSREYNSTHNTFLECFSENGILGLICFIIIIIQSLIGFHNHWKENNLVFVMYGVFLCVLLAGIGESFYNDVVLWMLVGYSLCGRKVLNKTLYYV